MKGIKNETIEELIENLKRDLTASPDQQVDVETLLITNFKAFKQEVEDNSAHQCGCKYRLVNPIYGAPPFLARAQEVPTYSGTRTRYTGPDIDT